jgi:hypothetical protein
MLKIYEQVEWGGVKLEIGVPKEANEITEKRTLITILGPLDTS